VWVSGIETAFFLKFNRTFVVWNGIVSLVNMQLYGGHHHIKHNLRDLYQHLHLGYHYFRSISKKKTICHHLFVNLKKLTCFFMFVSTKGGCLSLPVKASAWDWALAMLANMKDCMVETNRVPWAEDLFETGKRRRDESKCWMGFGRGHDYLNMLLFWILWMLCFLERDEKGSLFLKEHRNSWRVPPKKKDFLSLFMA